MVQPNLTVCLFEPAQQVERSLPESRNVFFKFIIIFTFQLLLKELFQDKVTKEDYEENPVVPHSPQALVKESTHDLSLYSALEKCLSIAPQGKYLLHIIKTI